MSPRPYRPSNGTEGEIFMGQWCAKCALDCHGKNPPDLPMEQSGSGEGSLILIWGDDEPLCEILGQAMAGGSPGEWVQDDAGPRCTAFRRDDALDEGFDPQGAMGLLL